jgi:hypothetical protein
MSSREEISTLWCHTQATAVLFGSELGIKVFLHYSGTFFLPGLAMQVVEPALTWFTVGTLLLSLASCFGTLSVMYCKTLFTAWESLKRARRVARDKPKPESERLPGVLTMVGSASETSGSTATAQKI